MKNLIKKQENRRKGKEQVRQTKEQEEVKMSLIPINLNGLNSPIE